MEKNQLAKNEKKKKPPYLAASWVAL